MVNTQPSTVSPPSPAPSRGQISYPEVAALAYRLSRSIAALSRNKSDSERRRLRVYEDVAQKIQFGLTRRRRPMIAEKISRADRGLALLERYRDRAKPPEEKFWPNGLGWTPLPELQRELGAQHGARIKELRDRGIAIENAMLVRPVDGSSHELVPTDSVPFPKFI